jgi:hypothetical protein
VPVSGSFVKRPEHFAEWRSRFFNQRATKLHKFKEKGLKDHVRKGNCVRLPLPKFSWNKCRYWHSCLIAACCTFDWLPTWSSTRVESEKEIIILGRVILLDKSKKMLSWFYFEEREKKCKLGSQLCVCVCAMRLRISDAPGRHAVCRKNSDDVWTISLNRTHTYT